MVNILLNGINGKMGQEVHKEALSCFENKCKIVCGIDITTTPSFNVTVYDNPRKVTENIDVIIDFSVPKASLKMLEYAKEKHLPVVIATTRFF